MRSDDPALQDKDAGFMREALQLARQGIENRQGGPFGALVVIEDEIVGRSWNQVVARNDPTAHAEILAIREACERLGKFHLTGATLYTTCEPCPMCLAAAHWARIQSIVFAAESEDAAAIGFNDKSILEALQQPLEQSGIGIRRQMRNEALALFRQWQKDQDKTAY